MAAYNAYHWSEKELQFIKDNFFTMTNPGLAKALGLKLTSVRTKFLELGLKRMELQYWTVEQTAYLKKNYRQKGDVEIAEYFATKYQKDKGWRNKQIEKKRKQMFLNRTSEELRAIKIRSVKKGKYRDGNLKKWQKMGVTPVGAIKVWKMENGNKAQYIKTKKGYTPYAREFYKRHVGKIPPNMVVRLIDGNTMNVVASNLNLLTRQENATINSKNRCPQELREVVKILNTLNKTIHEKQNQ